MHLRLDVIKTTSNRKCYMWYAKWCVLDSNCQWCIHWSPIWDGDH